MYRFVQAVLQGMSPRKVVEQFLAEVRRRTGGAGAWLGRFDPELAAVFLFGADLEDRSVGPALSASLRSWIAERLDPEWIALSGVEGWAVPLTTDDRGLIGVFGCAMARRPDPELVEAATCLLLAVFQAERIADETLLRRRADTSARRSQQALALASVKQARIEQLATELHDAHCALQESRDLLQQRVEERTLALQLANAELVRTTERANAANEAKSAFLANMSHELRTPLNVIRGYTEIAMEDLGVACSARGDLANVLRASDHLLSMINEILDLASIEAGRLLLEVSAVPLDPEIDAVCRDALPLLARSGTTLRWPPPSGLSVRSDARRLRQILLNLLSNAAKFTANGEVGVEIEATGDRIRITVWDTGIGIPAEAIPTLFDAFTQVDASPTRRFGGTGLGLAISRELARRMGGELTVQSTPGVGSRFTLEIHPSPAPARGARGALAVP